MALNIFSSVHLSHLYALLKYKTMVLKTGFVFFIFRDINFAVTFCSLGDILFPQLVFCFVLFCFFLFLFFYFSSFGKFFQGKFATLLHSS